MARAGTEFGLNMGLRFLGRISFALSKTMFFSAGMSFWISECRESKYGSVFSFGGW